MSCSSLLKFFIYSSAGLMIFLGLIMEIFFLVLGCGRFAEATESKGLLIATGTVFFVFMLIAALLGICGFKNGSAWMLIIYSIIALLVFVTFWIAFAYLKKGKTNIHEDFFEVCNGQKDTGLMADLNRVYRDDLSSIFCTIRCPCNLDKTRVPATIDYTYAEVSIDGAKTISECEDDPTAKHSRTIRSFIGWMEEKLECSGVCTLDVWYYFSDVNRGKPPYRCGDKLLDYVDCKPASNE
eukprot:TRINITY_DN12989_c0_g1_i23.p1 TRINITY_DN12989_c0_g1~~TRINITY_DN12989_c0_g1_i23.p1  ORF type:complete len:239 (-),score=62.01 TRINITY_DN12989_c0_g1_i23:292-1008(-)